MVLIYIDKNKRGYDETSMKNMNIDYVASVDPLIWDRMSRNPDTWDIVDGKLVDNTITDEYKEKILIKKMTVAYGNITSKYDEAINYGVFALDNTYFANMAWYNTWTKVLDLYENPLNSTLPETFDVRLYKKVDGVYYNYNVSQTVDTFKVLVNTLNSRQFFLYQPIRTQLLTALQKAETDKSEVELEALLPLIDTSFGDIINETITLIANGQ